jgi:NAD-dependent SIR2 family protein deacetylase
LKRHILERAKGHVVLCQLIKTFGRSDPAFVLLLGAGTSDSSGIPTVSKMVLSWQKSLYKERTGTEADANPSAFATWIATDYPSWKRQAALTPQFGEIYDYPLLFSHFYSERGSRQRHMEELIKGKLPTIGYAYLAGLIDDGYFNRILTTNFDDLIADALFRYYNVRAYSLAFDSALTSIRLVAL